MTEGIKNQFIIISSGNKTFKTTRVDPLFNENKKR